MKCVIKLSFNDKSFSLENIFLIIERKTFLSEDFRFFIGLYFSYIFLSFVFILFIFLFDESIKEKKILYYEYEKSSFQKMKCYKYKFSLSVILLL